MDLYELSFARIIVLQDDIAEVIINDGVEMNEQMVDEYHDFLISHLAAPFSLLVNKINSYSYDFTAQRKLATIDQVNAMAVVVYNRRTEIATDSLAKFPRDKPWNIRIFADRDLALEWLEGQQKPSS